jgi:hypothetical protein
MKRLLIIACLGGTLALPGPVAAFHHVFLPGPAMDCAEPADVAGNNLTAAGAIRDRNPEFNPGAGMPPSGRENAPDDAAQCPSE